jgi:hypothetical protein
VAFAEIGLWLAALVISALAVASVVWALVRGISPRWLAVSSYSMLFVYCLLGGAAVTWCSTHGGQFAAALRVAALLCITGVCIAHLVFHHVVSGGTWFRNGWKLAVPRQYLLGGFAVVYLVLLVITARQFYRTAARVEDVTLTGFAPRFEPIEDFYLVTDKGRRLLGLRAYLPQNTHEEAADAPARLLDGYLIRQAPVDPRSNCHGWIFADGRCVILADAVEAILKDNGYRRVDVPQAGDLIIYRDPKGMIMHSGLVRGILDDGTPLIESKWAFGARYLHRPQDQIFSNIYSYYRTDRKSELTDVRSRHLVDIVLTQTERIPPGEINADAKNSPSSNYSAPGR